jgi:hypothetical protein
VTVEPLAEFVPSSLNVGLAPAGRVVAAQV